jgi:chromate transporter
MSSDSPSVPSSGATAAAANPTVFELFLVFARISVSGFGGVLIWTRRAIVDQHRWMTAEEFNETFALCHFLPGPNVVNLTVVFGSRFRGIAGGLAAFVGLLGPPVVIVTILAALYARFGDVEALRRILAGISCAAVGLLLSVISRMILPLLKKRDVVALALLAAVFVAVGIVRLPLPLVILAATPISIAVTFAARRGARA